LKEKMPYESKMKKKKKIIPEDIPIIFITD